MKLYKYLNKSITIMLLTAVMVGFLSCDDDDQDLGSGSLTNAVIQSVNVQSGNDWKEATQVRWERKYVWRVTTYPLFLRHILMDWKWLLRIF